jgi:hypothetical protein
MVMRMTMGVAIACNSIVKTKNPTSDVPPGIAL